MNPEIPKFEYGEKVRVVRTIKNDGTVLGKSKGDKLVTCGSTGYVRGVGRFLQDQIIYQVHFIEQDITIGCRDRELIGADEPWLESRFINGDTVQAAIALGSQGQIWVEPGRNGRIMKVHRVEPISYDVAFGDKVYRVPEAALTAQEEVNS